MLRPKATKVSALSGYRLKITFDNGEVKVFDVSPYIKGSWFGELADSELFKSVRINGTSVDWSGGQDICPDDLYYESVPIDEYELSGGARRHQASSVAEDQGI